MLLLLLFPLLLTEQHTRPRRRTLHLHAHARQCLHRTARLASRPAKRSEIVRPHQHRGGLLHAVHAPRLVLLRAGLRGGPVATPRERIHVSSRRKQRHLVAVAPRARLVARVPLRKRADLRREHGEVPVDAGRGQERELLVERAHDLPLGVEARREHVKVAAVGLGVDACVGAARAL